MHKLCHRNQPPFINVCRLCARDTHRLRYFVGPCVTVEEPPCPIRGCHEPPASGGQGFPRANTQTSTALQKHLFGVELYVSSAQPVGDGVSREHPPVVREREHRARNGRPLSVSHKVHLRAHKHVVGFRVLTYIPGAQPSHSLL